MSAATDAYKRLLNAQRNPPSPEVLEQYEAQRQREEVNRKIRLRLPKNA